MPAKRSRRMSMNNGNNSANRHKSKRHRRKSSNGKGRKSRRMSMNNGNNNGKGSRRSRKRRERVGMMGSSKTNDDAAKQAKLEQRKAKLAQMREAREKKKGERKVEVDEVLAELNRTLMKHTTPSEKMREKFEKTEHAFNMKAAATAAKDRRAGAKRRIVPLKSDEITYGTQSNHPSLNPVSVDPVEVQLATKGEQTPK